MTGPSTAHTDAVIARRRYERQQARIADVHALADERRRAREAEPRMLDPVSVRVHRPGYMTTF